MDSIDIFKKLTTNLAFNKNNGSNLKRKLEHGHDDEKLLVKKQVIENLSKNEEKSELNKPSQSNGKTKKKNLLKIHEESVIFIEYKMLKALKIYKVSY
jgi:hypothetical protein